MSKFFLILESGEPYSAGHKVPLCKEEFLLGRASADQIPDLALSNLCVSRRHALLSSEASGYRLTDLNSKHGTQLNEVKIESLKPVLLKDNDKISLANGVANLVFKKEEVSDETVDFSSFILATRDNSGGLSINPALREVTIDRKPITLTGKDLELLLFLFKNANRAVSYLQIKEAVWPERPAALDNAPDVGNDEIIALVYRLRKKLGPYSGHINAVPRFGYLLKI